MSNSCNYVVATTKSWNIENFNQRWAQNPQWHLITEPNELTTELIGELKPKYIFFPHWSWIVSEEITRQYECVCFHMTDLPYGRGGSPLQNLIVNGHAETKLSVLRMTEELDAGPIYFQLPLALDGKAEEIFRRCSALSFDAIATMVETNPIPQPQVGKPTFFKRRRPAQSELKQVDSVTQFFDHVRMLDAEGYPKAFICHNGLRLEFSEAELSEGVVTANVKVFKTDE